ncbi:SusC/RagA family TonB-linked outer membrane protein [Aestuariibaculum marinum]|uniref:SusC/RagA family TonB-linked outer membrane protein n=1 Tax=Aestuariibaculum marinum TaxID=2683592 RepID=A0A8J6Q4K9_9FLAO|nr:SusC/RagA family TonB-linked outer membrane protein [Aestuariibaculum marinum]MBD0824169.1 SusC/RagA family TonB-linked outer membrane protein [Aestuariibaculum marinum]
MKTKFSGILTLLLAFVVHLSYAQEKTISGTVIDSYGLPLPGATIIVKGTSSGTSSDFDGKYVIQANQGATLVFSFVGYTSEEVTVGASSTINVTMTEDAAALEEVVVVAFGTTTKEAFTGSASVVEAESLELRPLTSPIAAIEGNATGVQFLSASGSPGSSPSIVIRGVGTLNGDTDPLYIVDGVSFQGGLSTLNQDDIESITVLKDAASTSLYGSRAANGVVIITTKKGKKASGITVNATSQFGVITKGIDEYDAVNPGEYYELMWQSYKNSLGGDAAAAAQASATIFNRLGRNPFDVPNDQIVDTDGNLNPNANLIAKDLDWYDALERTGSRQNHSVNVSGGGENHSVFFSASNLAEKGYVIQSGYDRTTGRLSGTFNATDWLSMGGNVNFASEKFTGSPSRGSSIANVFGFAKNMGSIYSPYLLDPTTGDYIYDEAGNIRWDRGESISSLGIQSRPTNVGRNALEEAILNNELTKRNNYGFRYNADFTIIEGLKVSLIYGQDIQDSYNKSYENPEVGDGAPTARFQDNRFRRTVENFNQLITYNKSLGNHNFDLTLGHESFDRNFTENSAFKSTETISGIYELDNFSVVLDASGSSTDYKLEGFLGRLNYNFADKYYLSASARRDGSSVFTNNKWGTFYSFGGSWRISQEEFMKDVSFVNNLKLRGSYGEVGNDQLGNYYVSQPLYAIYPNAGTPGLRWDTTGNADLQWETSESWDVALEFGLFNNRLTGAFEFYKKISSDLLYNVPIPPSEGQIEAPDNVGDLFNQGLEIGLNGLIVDKKNFTWNLGINASTLKNEITYLPSPFIDGSKRWEEGRSRFDFFVYDYAGVDPSNGDALFYMYEETEDAVGVPVLNDNGTHATTNDYLDAGKGYVGASAVPDLIGSISNSFSFGNIDLNFLFTYQIGGDILDYGYADMMHQGEYGESLHPDALKAWKNPGDITSVPRLENGNTLLAPSLSSRWLTDASYLALRNINLAYNLSSSTADQIGVDKLRIFVTGENLAMFAKRTGLNPQYNLSGTPSGNDYNPNRVISLGVNVAF